jgi:hypothetical protein
MTAPISSYMQATVEARCMTLRNECLRFPDESYVTSDGPRGSHPLNFDDLERRSAPDSLD